MGRREIGEREVREEPRNIEPGSGPIAVSGGEVRPGVEAQTVQGAEKGEVIQSWETQRKGAA